MDRTKPSKTPLFTAVKTEPLGQTLLIPTEELADYHAIVAAVNGQFRPATTTEKLLAQSIVNHRWRLRRVERLRGALYRLAWRTIGGKGAEENDPARQAEWMTTDAPVERQKEWRTLLRQERFLRTQLKKDTVELNKLLRDNRTSRRGLFLVPKRTT